MQCGRAARHLGLISAPGRRLRAVTLELVDHRAPAAVKNSWTPFLSSEGYEHPDWWENAGGAVGDPWFVEVSEHGLQVARVQLDERGGAATATSCLRTRSIIPGRDEQTGWSGVTSPATGAVPVALLMQTVYALRGAGRVRGASWGAVTYGSGGAATSIGCVWGEVLPATARFRQA